MKVNDLIDSLYLLDGNTEITILETKGNVTQWRPLEERDFDTIKHGNKIVLRLHPNIAYQIEKPSEFYIG